MTRTFVPFAVVAAAFFGAASTSLAAGGSTSSYQYLSSGIGGDMAVVDNSGQSSQGRQQEQSGQIQNQPAPPPSCGGHGFLGGQDRIYCND